MEEMFKEYMKRKKSDEEFIEREMNRKNKNKNKNKNKK